MQLEYNCERYGQMFLTFLQKDEGGDVLFQVDYADRILKSGNFYTLHADDAKKPNVRNKFKVIK